MLDIKKICVFLLMSMAYVTHAQVNVLFKKPLIDKVFQKGDTISVLGIVKANESLHEILLIIQDSADNSVQLFTKNYHSHSQMLEININYIVTFNESKTLKIMIQTIGHDGIKTSNNEINVKCNEVKKILPKRKLKTKKGLNKL